VRLVVSGEVSEIEMRLKADPALASFAAVVGASRDNEKDYFFTEISHYMYAGDTALHMAAAAFRREIAEILVKHGADIHAKNRRGAQPIHYAADRNHINTIAQADTIGYLLSAGADPNAADKNGVTPLHRAVRTRSLESVRALLDGGADPGVRNNNGSTPFHLAVQSTGRSGTGETAAIDAQISIIEELLSRGVDPGMRDGKGHTVIECARGDRIKKMFAGK
jgi:ankyrin repeat protein